VRGMGRREQREHMGKGRSEEDSVGEYGEKVLEGR